MTRPPELRLEGRTALVTGASRGIGRAVSLALAEAGADVIGAARSAPGLEDLGREVTRLGRSFLPLATDIADVEGTAGRLPAAWRWRGAIDILVNAAGTVVRSQPPDVTVEDWDSTFAVNLRGTFFLTQTVGALMLGRGSGAVVSVASLAGEVATRAPVAYSCSKAALIQLTRALAVRWAPTVRVNAVGPAYVRTALNSDWLADETNLSWVLERTPAARLGEPGDVAGAVLFLASPLASYVTGQHLLVDGGWSAQ